MSQTTIVGNNHWIDLVAYPELPAAEQQFYAGAYCDSDASPTYFRYRGDWFTLADFTRIVTADAAVGFEHGTRDPAIAAWQGIMHGTIDSGWLVRMAHDGGEHYGQVQAARFY